MSEGANKDETPETQKTFTCIICPKGCTISVHENEQGELVILGNECKRGLDYATAEYKQPKRILATTVWIRRTKVPLVPVRTSGPIPKDRLDDVLDLLATVVVDAPVTCGDVIVENVLGLGEHVIATRTLRVAECRAIACELE